MTRLLREGVCSCLSSSPCMLGVRHPFPSGQASACWDLGLGDPVASLLGTAASAPRCLPLPCSVLSKGPALKRKKEKRASLYLLNCALLTPGTLGLLNVDLPGVQLVTRSPKRELVQQVVAVVVPEAPPEAPFRVQVTKSAWLWGSEGRVCFSLVSWPLLAPPL